MQKITLKLNEARPDSLDIKRLGEYLKKLADLYGSADTLYLDGVDEGSACLNFMVDDDHADTVKSRVVNASRDVGAKTYRKAYQKVVSLMDADGYSGSFSVNDQEIIRLASRNARPKKDELRQSMPTSIKGKIFRVGGTDDTVPVRLSSLEGEIIYAQTSVELSKELGASLYQYIHAHGEGEWVSEKPGNWRLAKITIERYEIIEHMSAKDALLKLRKLGGIKQEPADQSHANIFDYRR